MADIKLFQCNNSTCTLGIMGEPGYFTGGMRQDPNTYEIWEEEGYCPNCYTQGKASGKFVPIPEGIDYHQELREEVQAQVDSGELAPENAHGFFLAAAIKREQDEGWGEGVPMRERDEAGMWLVPPSERVE